MQIFKTPCPRSSSIDFKSNIGKIAICSLCALFSSGQLIRNDLDCPNENFITKTRNTFYKKYQLNLSITWLLKNKTKLSSEDWVLLTYNIINCSNWRFNWIEPYVYNLTNSWCSKAFMVANVGLVWLMILLSRINRKILVSLYQQNKSDGENYLNLKRETSSYIDSCGSDHSYSKVVELWIGELGSIVLNICINMITWLNSPERL